MAHPGTPDTSVRPNAEYPVPDASFLLLGDYSRDGFDLVITNPAGETFVVHDYFGMFAPPNLVLDTGVGLSPVMVRALLRVPFDGVLFAGEATEAAELVQIGLVTVAIGRVVAVGQDGTERVLKRGDALYKGDVIETGARSFVKATMNDGTRFHLGRDGRAALTDYEFDESADRGTFEATVFVGGFHYKSGRIGTMFQGTTGSHSKIRTPSAIIGIRGSELDGTVDSTGETIIVHRSGYLVISDINEQNEVVLEVTGATSVIVLNGLPSFTTAPTPAQLQQLEATLPPPDTDDADAATGGQSEDDGEASEDDAAAAGADGDAEDDTAETDDEVAAAEDEGEEDEADDEEGDETEDGAGEEETGEDATEGVEADGSDGEDGADDDAPANDGTSATGEGDAAADGDGDGDEGGGEGADANDTRADGDDTTGDGDDPAGDGTGTETGNGNGEDGAVASAGTHGGAAGADGDSGTGVSDDGAGTDGDAGTGAASAGADGGDGAGRDAGNGDTGTGDTGTGGAGTSSGFADDSGGLGDTGTSGDGTTGDTGTGSTGSRGATGDQSGTPPTDSATGGQDDTGEILPPNNPPEAVDDTVSVPEGEAADLYSTLIDNDSDPDAGNTFGITAVSETGAVGTLVLDSAATSLTYSADGATHDSLGAGATLTETFSYTLTDSGGATSTATVTVTVTGVNDDPVAAGDAYAVAADESLTVDAGEGLLANDTDVDEGSTLTLVAAGSITDEGAVVAIQPDGSFVFVANSSTALTALAEGETFDAMLGYEVSDGQGGTDIATATVTVTGVNDAPVAIDDAADVAEKGATVVNVLMNDADVDNGDTLTLSGLFQSDGTPLADLQFQSNGEVTVTPGAGFFALGNDETAAVVLTYEISDALGATATGTVELTVLGVNDSPVAEDDAFDVPEDDAAAVRSLLDNDTDVEPGGLVIISIDDASTRGEVSLVDGVVRYGPAGAFNALAEGEEAFDSFSYTVVDAQGETDMATATVRVIGANDAPQTTPGSLQFDENDGEQLVDLTHFAADPDGASLTFGNLRVSGGAAGIAVGLTLQEDGTLRVDTDEIVGLPAGTTLSLALQYDADDGAALVNSVTGGTLTLDILGTDDAPVAVGTLADAAVDEDTAVNLPVDGAVFEDVDGDTLTLTASGLPSSLLFDGSTITGTPLNDDVGVYTVTINATDPGLLSASRAFSLTVVNTNDTPLPGDDGYTTAEDAQLSVPAGDGVLANDVDPDADVLMAAGVVSPPANGSVSLAEDGSFLYSPDADFNGMDAFSYEVTDPSGATATASVSITVNPVNTLTVTEYRYPLLEDVSDVSGITTGVGVSFVNEGTVTLNGVNAPISIDGGFFNAADGVLNLDGGTAAADRITFDQPLQNDGSIFFDQTALTDSDANILEVLNSGSPGANLVNTGLFSVVDTMSIGGDRIFDGRFVNQGQLLAGHRFTLDATPAGISHTNAGVLDIAAGVVVELGTDDDLWNLSSGVISGEGTLRTNGTGVDFLSSGTIAPGTGGAGILTIDGDADLDVDSVLSFEIGGTNAGTNYDRLDVTGNLNSRGRIDITLINAFVPLTSDSFTLVDGTAPVDGFDGFSGLEISATQVLSVAFNPTNLVVTVVDVTNVYTAADDVINATGAADVLMGGSGDDSFLLLDAADIAFGQAGRDFFDMSLTPSVARVDGGAGIDTILRPSSGDYTADVFHHIDNIEIWSLADAAAQTIIIDADVIRGLTDGPNTLTHDDAALVIIGDEGDVVQIADGEWSFDGDHVLPIDLSLQYTIRVVDGDGVALYVDEFVRLEVTRDDTSVLLIGGSSNETLNGTGGDDLIDGRGGSDQSFAGAGDDTLVFDEDDTVMDGGAGLDTLEFLVGQDIDLSFSGNLSGIERIDLRSNGEADTLDLNIRDILDFVTDNELDNFAGLNDGTIKLLIDAGSEDTIILNDVELNNITDGLNHGIDSNYVPFDALGDDELYISFTDVTGKLQLLIHQDAIDSTPN